MRARDQVHRAVAYIARTGQTRDRGGSGWRVGGEQSLEFSFDDGVTLARARFESVTIQNCDSAASIFDEPCALQVSRGFRHALAAHAQHIGDELLSHHENVAVQSVETQQQPAAQLLVEGVMTIAHRCLRHLREQRLGVTQ